MHRQGAITDGELAAALAEELATPVARHPGTEPVGDADASGGRDDGSDPGEDEGPPGPDVEESPSGTYLSR